MRRERITVMLGLLGAVLATPVYGGAINEEKNGKYYYDALRASITEVIAENQALINHNADGSVKNAKLEPKEFFRNTYKTFKTIVGADFSVSSLKVEQDPERISHILACFLQAGRVNTAKSQGMINKEQDGSVKLKKFIPAVFGRLTAERFLEKTGVRIKQTTLGKGEFKARNAYNEPDSWEASALETISAKRWEFNKGFGEMVGNDYHYAKPVYIKRACMKCHGAPIGEKGPYGHSKEGYEVGEVRGAISITIDNVH